MTTQIIPQNTVVHNTVLDLQAFEVAVMPEVRIGTHVPTCPAEVDPTTSLADLRDIKSHWVNIAEQTGDLKTIILVIREQGLAITDTHWTLTLQTPAGQLVGDLDVTGFQTWRNGQYAQLTITLNGKAVCKIERSARRMYGAPLFVPGTWVDTFRQRHPQAEANAISRYQNAIENDRLALLAELGVEVQ